MATQKKEMAIYLLVRTDLTMGKGKIAGQCGHAVQELVFNCPRSVMDQYRQSAHPKIVLKVPSEEVMDQIRELCQAKNILHAQIIDAGRTQIAPNSKTVLGVGPIDRSEVPKEISDLKLL